MSSDTETSYSESLDNCELKKKCESCESSFHIFKRKRQCYFCKLSYCRNCVELCFLNTGTENNNHESNQNRKLKRHPMSTRTCRACSNCITMSSSRTTYNQLMSIDLKYLKLFLTNSNTPGVETLTEKSQFVDLLISKTRNEDLTNASRANSVNAESELIEETNQKYLKFKASLSDLTCLDDIEKLNNKRIKQILASNFVHFKCTSNRSELIAKLKSLYLTNQENKKLDTKHVINVNNISLEDTKSNNASHDMCKICMEYVIDCVLLDCGHMVVCTKCAKQLNDCPICRSEVMKIIRVFKS